jgi:chaperonin GroES
MAIVLQPIGDRLLVKPLARQEISRGGIVLPDTVKEKPQEGEVVAVGPGRRTDRNEVLPMDVKVGEIVLYAKWGGAEIKIEGEDYIFLHETDVLAKRPK